LFLARDRAGEKPLFYWRVPGKLVFASELKAIMADPAFPRYLNAEALNHYLAYGYVPGEMCMLRGVRKLGQGQAMTYEIDSGLSHLWRYWKLPESSVQTSSCVEALVEDLERHLRNSVK